MQGMGWYWVVDRRMGNGREDVAEVDLKTKSKAF